MIDRPPMSRDSRAFQATRGSGAWVASQSVADGARAPSATPAPLLVGVLECVNEGGRAFQRKAP